jgi:hypothetical protein
VPDWDNTESRESDEDAAWRDLVARLEEPATTTGPVPWPEREDVPRPRPQHARGADGTSGAPEGRDQPGAKDSPGSDVPDGPAMLRGTEGTREGRDAEETSRPRGTERPGAEGPRGAERPRGAEGIRGFDDEGTRGAFSADAQPEGFEPGALQPDVIQGARPERRAAHGTHARRIRARKAPAPASPSDEEHYIPPAPPPLPKLDPMAKGAWAALFGGPGYLVVATAAGWSVPGIAAFCAVAAFVTGFAILVLRMNEPEPGDPDDGDDGAVV